MRTESRATESFTREILADIPEREAIVLKTLFGIDYVKPQTLREVGQRLNIFNERVRQFRDQALRRLKNGRFKNILQEKLKASI